MPRRHQLPAAPFLVVSLALLAAACGGTDVEPATSDRTGTSVRITVDESTDDGGATSSSPASTAASAEPATEDGETTGGTEDDRSQETTSTAATGPAAAGAWPSTVYRLVEVASVRFPTTLITRPGSDDLWVAEREGVIRQLRRNGNGFDLAAEPTSTSRPGSAPRARAGCWA